MDNIKKILRPEILVLAIAIILLVVGVIHWRQSSIPPVSVSTSVSPVVQKLDFVPPLNRAGERVTKKTFGIFITPQNSPVQPEKFTGYHTGADFEIFSQELNSPVSVHAVCSGKLILKESATGYGGVVVQSCSLNNLPITIVYGHLKLTSVTANAGDSISAGDTIGVLGAGYSSETDGERKHLHLGFHRGSVINILGYVQSSAQLTGWIDPCQYVCHN